MIRIRSRRPESDDGRLYALVARRLIPYARKARPDSVYKRKDIIRRFNECRVLVAAPRGRLPAGFISFKAVKGILTIDMLAVDRLQEGRGIGGSLIAAVERYAEKQGISVIRLAVDEPNIHARRFYEGKGFRVVHRLPDYGVFILSKTL